jgi:uncharacterized protein (TIGR02246 family)
MSRQDVENGEKQWLEAFNAGDAAGVTAMYTSDGRLLAPNMDTVQGSDALRGFVQGFIDTGAKLAFSLTAVHETADLCASVGRYDMTFPGTDIPADRGKFIEVWKRQADGEWRIVDDIFNSDLPAAAG